MVPKTSGLSPQQRGRADAPELGAKTPLKPDVQTNHARSGDRLPPQRATPRTRGRVVTNGWQARLLRVVGAVGSVLRLFSFSLLLPVVIALIYDAQTLSVGPTRLAPGVLVFLGCFVLAFSAGWAMAWCARRPESSQLRDPEAYLTVGVGWLVLCLVSMLPFIMLGVLRDPVDAFFETMSGLTTTGATVIAGELEAVPKSLMVWRAQLQFIGGMGIIVLSVALLARLTQGGMQLLQAEAPGPAVHRIKPRLAQTARLLWTVYASLAGVLFVILMGVLARHGFTFKQTVYEAIILTFTTISTGGFGAHGESIAYFHDSLLEALLIVFMLISGMNYTLHYYAVRGRPSKLLRDPESRFFLGTFLVVTLTVTALLVRSGQAAGNGLRDAAFTSASLITSTGFTTADFDLWPAAGKLLLLLLMVTGATAGSTGGGVKHIRVLLMFQLLRRQMRRALHPRAVIPVKLGNRTIEQNTILTMSAFLLAFVTVWILGSILLLVFDPAFDSMVDAMGASVSALSNMGPGFGVVGPTLNYAGITAFSKILLAMEMWFGRLEIFAALVVFTPASWRP